MILVDGLEQGRLKIVEFPGRPAVSKIGYSYFGAPLGVAPQPAASTTVQQGRLESSNVNVPAEASQLMLAVRHFQMMRRVASLVGDEMNGRAVEELGRTS